MGGVPVIKGQAEGVVLPEDIARGIHYGGGSAHLVKHHRFSFFKTLGVLNKPRIEPLPAVKE